MKQLNTFLRAVLAGLSISIGGVVFLACENRLAGAALFSVGLLAVCTLGLNLYTGKICYVFDNGLGYLAQCGLIWLGNLVGALAAGFAIRATRLSSLIEKAQAVSQIKLSDGLVSIFILAMFCNFLIYLAVENYKNNPHEIGKYLGIFMGVIVFVVAGFEHCIANMFYFTVAGAWSLRTLGYILIMTLGNSVGGILVPLLRHLGEPKNQP